MVVTGRRCHCARPCYGGGRMTQWRRSLFLAGLISLSACTDSIAPPVPPPAPPPPPPAPPPPGVASKLALSVQPGTATAGVAMSPLAVTIEDSSGKTVTSATSVVTVALDTNAG